MKAESGALDRHFAICSAFCLHPSAFDQICVFVLCGGE
jgi:hypothetical protein